MFMHGCECVYPCVVCLATDTNNRHVGQRRVCFGCCGLFRKLHCVCSVMQESWSLCWADGKEVMYVFMCDTYLHAHARWMHKEHKEGSLKYLKWNNRLSEAKSLQAKRKAHSTLRRSEMLMTEIQSHYIHTNTMAHLHRYKTHTCRRTRIRRISFSLFGANVFS